MATSPLDQERELRITRRYPVAREKVWRAWTEPEALSRWFGPGEPGSVLRAEVDLREGGRWRIRFRTPDGEEHEVGGTYQELRAPERLVTTWAWHSTPERVSRLSVRLHAVAEGTELELVHDRFVDVQARTNHVRGWTATIANLDAYLARRTA